MAQYNYSQEELKTKVITKAASDFLYTIEKSFNKDYPWWDSRYIYWSLSHVGVGCNTFVQKRNNRLGITLDINDIDNYADINKVDIEVATKLLLSHEIFHILLGHFSSKYKNHNKRLLNIAGDIEINQLIGLKAPGLQASDFELKPFRTTDYYYDILKAELDAKMEEQKDIDLNMPMFDNVDTEDDEMPEDAEQLGNSLGEDTSSEITSDELENEEENKESSSKLEDMIDEQSDFDEDEEDSSGNYNKLRDAFSNDDIEKPTDETSASNSGRNPKSLEDMMIDEMIPENREVNETTSEMMEQQEIDIDINLKKICDIENAIKKDLAKEDTYTVKGLKEIIKKIENKEKAIKITPHDKVNTYHKFNNRRKNGNFILPGKRLTNEGVKKKYDSSLTVFIDVSGSTSGRINTDLMNIAKKMHNLGATIVYYEDTITSICEPDSLFFTEPARGGTDITRVIPEYLKDHELERAYVFTDGEDDFTLMKDVCKKFNVYFIDNYSHHVYEKFTEKSTNFSTRWSSRW